MKKTFKKRGIKVGAIILLVIILLLGAFLITRKHYEYPTEEKVSNKCGIFDGKKAKKVKISYEKVEQVVGHDDVTGEDIKDKLFKIKVSNIKDEYRVEVYNDYTKETKELSVENKSASYETIYSKDIIKYTINIIRKNGKCKGETIRTITVTLPVINNYSEYAECKEKINKKYKYCKEEIYESLPSVEEFKKGVK